MHLARSMQLIAIIAAFCAAVMAPKLFANVVGSDLQNFNAVPGGIDYVTVHSSETLGPGFFNASLMANHAVNSLPHFNDESAQDRLRTGDTLTMGDFGLGIGLFKDFEVGATAQYLARQTVNQGEERGQFTSTGVIDYRLYTKLRMAGDEKSGLALIGSGVFNRVRNNPYIGKGGSDIGIIEMAGDTKFIGINMALNIGYRFRKKGEPIPGYLIQPVGNQYIASCGMSYLLPFSDTKLIIEAFGSRPDERHSTGLIARQGSSAELLGGIKQDLSDNLALQAGLATEMIHGVSSPDWRVYVGLNWATEAKVAPEPPPPAVAGALPLPPPRLKAVAPREERATLRNLNFASGSSEIPQEGVAVLAALAGEINASSFDKIIIEGHTDSVGRAALNQELSKRRAEAVREWLIQNGKVPAEKIEAAGYGSAHPIADNGNLQGRALNRRVEVRVMRSDTPAEPAVKEINSPPPVNPPPPSDTPPPSGL